MTSDNEQSLKVWKQKFKQLPAGQVAPTLDARPDATRAARCGVVADITDVDTDEGWRYVACVLDRRSGLAISGAPNWFLVTAAAGPTV